MQQEAAQIVALQALNWLLSNTTNLGAFLSATGLGANDLAARAHDAEFHASILDFLLTDDQWILGFCDATGLAYTAPMAARLALPGGEQEHWT